MGRFRLNKSMRASESGGGVRVIGSGLGMAGWLSDVLDGVWRVLESGRELVRVLKSG